MNKTLMTKRMFDDVFGCVVKEITTNKSHKGYSEPLYVLLRKPNVATVVYDVK